ncbi:tetratricopeptide repeat protein [Neochlamydia sp. AcF95]|uniref:tetratricopeptide repeat protein n=1 Tax=Neochlamydia sp. AcF95 TaxID=2795734 RepID=UPI001BC93744|nr:tetratricopeptide repeat protein [Neochlamydia sp. AcF95]MBS4171547.1 hypothetical protein [Neochlamydia sp. AcF95]
MNLENTHSSTILPTNTSSLLIAKGNTFDPPNHLATLPLEIFQKVFLSFSNLSEGELRKILDARSCARVLKQFMPNNVKFLQLYQPQKLQFYYDKLSSHLNQNPFSIDNSHNFLSVYRVEEHYTHTLKFAIQEEDPLQIRACIEKLGDIHLIKGTPQTLLQAAGLYNYALHNASLGEQESIKEKLSKVEILLSKACKRKPLDISITKKQFENNREGLKNFRDKIEEKIQTLGSNPLSGEVQELYGEIAQWMKAFFKTLADQAQEVLGPEPCTYAMIGFGSLAREEITPYSDLEFGILIQEDTSENRDYFKRLTTLIHFKVINLGETILPALNIPCIKKIKLFDSVTPRGFAFDGAGVKGKGCKTPLGNGKTFELIQTPQKMAQYVGKDDENQWWHKKERHLPMELLNFTHLLGSNELTEQYRQKVQENLNTPYQEGLNLGQHLAKYHLARKDRKAFNPRIHGLETQGMLFQVKNDLYRFPHLALDRLALLEKIIVSNTFARINQLKDKGILTNKAAEHLNEWMSIALFMRLKTYSHYEAQKEMMNPILKPYSSGIPKLIEKQFPLDQDALNKIKKIYSIFIPFHKVMKKFLSGEKSYLTSSDLNDNSPQTLGDIALRLFQMEEAKQYYILAKKEDPCNSGVLSTLGIIYQAHGDLIKSYLHGKAALKINLKNHGKNSLAVAISYNNLAQIYQEEGKLRKAKEYTKRALKIEHKILNDRNHPKLADYYNNLGMIYQEQEELRKAARHARKAIRLRSSYRIKNDLQKAIYYHNLGTIYKDLEKLDKAIKYISKARDIYSKLFSEHHPRALGCLNNLGTVYRNQRNFTKAITSLKQVINSCQVADKAYLTLRECALNNLSLVYRDQKKIEKALTLAIEALNINLNNFDKDSPRVEISYNTLGMIYLDRGNFEQAEENVNEALAIAIKIYGEEHAIVAGYHINLGAIYKAQDKFEEAIKETNQAIFIYKRHSDKNHLKRIGKCNNNLKELYDAQGKLELAVRYAKRIS